MLTIFRRHLRECARTSRRYRRCACPIHVEGSLRGEKIRKALDLTSWEAASDLIRSWETSGEIGLVKSTVPAVQEAIGKYITEAEEQNLNPESVKKMRDAVERLFGGHCARKGYRHLRQLGIEELRAYRTELNKSYAVSSLRTRLEYMRAFFRFCEESGWLKVNPARKVRLPKQESEAIDTFTPTEIDRMLAIADSFNHRGVYGYGNRKRIRAMVLLLRYSGLRISDASVLGRARLDGDKLSLPTRKTGSIIWLPLPAETVKALNESPSDDSRYFFWNGSCLPTSAVKIWENTFTRVFELSKIPEEKRFIHNFRHTFATDLLQRGIPIEDVAALLGNSVKIVEKHYSHFVKARRDRLEERVRALWS